MNFLVLGAATLALTGSSAGVDDSESEWLGLDREVRNLASSLSADEGLDISGFLRIRYESSSDTPFLPSVSAAEGGTPGDLGGFSVTNARVAFEGQVGDYGFKVQEEFAPTAKIKDAKAWWNCGENVKMTFGNFKTPFSIRFLNSEQKQVFMDRTWTATGANKGLFFDRDVGLMASGKAGDRFKWDVAVQNGVDDVADEYLLSGRASVDVLGEGVLKHEGGYGLQNMDEGALRLALGFADDGASDNADALTFEATYNQDPFVLSAAVFDFGSDVGDNSPFDVYFSWMFTPDEWEGAIRFEDLDDAANSTAITVGVNKYVGGTDKKWQANVRTQDSDDPNLDGTIVQVGLNLAFP